VTRDAASPKAQVLARLGAQAVEASLTVEGSLRGAFDGVYGAFLVTPYWEHRSPARELAVHLPLGDAPIAGVASDDIGQVVPYRVHLAGDAAAAGDATEDALTGTALARQLGLEGEEMFGVDSSMKVMIASENNTARRRFPDFLTDSNSYPPSVSPSEISGISSTLANATTRRFPS
jgi:hypothetical protein